MTNDPLGLFDDSSDPLGLFNEDQHKPSTFLENVGGTAAALGDIASGVIKMPAGIGAAIGGTIRDALTGTPGDINAQRQAGQEATEALLPSIGQSIGGANTDAYQTIMKPFSALGEGIDWLGNKGSQLTGSQNVGGATKLGADIATLGIGIPGAKAVGRGARAVLEAVDPGLRNAGKPRADVQEVLKKQAELDASKGAEAPANTDPLGLFDDSLRQMDLLEPDNQGKAANPYEAQHGYWVTDENGIPVRADLSMEAANLENPLQRNLFGDELPPRETPRGQAAPLPMDRDIMGSEQLTGKDVSPESIGITQAMDKTRSAFENAESLPEAMDRMDQIQMQVDSLSHDLKANGEMQRALMDAEQTTPRSPFTDPTIRSTGQFTRQRGAINPEIFKNGYEAVKKIGDYTMRLIGDERYPSILIQDKEGKVIGGLDPSAQWKGGEQDMVADMVHIDDAHRGKGLAQEAYKFLAEQGNDVSRSDVQLSDGKRLWEKMEANGTAQNGRIPAKKYVPLKQRGAVGNLNPGKKARTIVDDLKDRFSKENPMIPENPNPKEVVAQALEEGKDSKQFKYTESGATLAAMKRGSAAIEGAARIIQNAVKRADYAVREMVFPTEKALKGLSKGELESLAQVMKTEMLQGKRFSPDALASLSVKQQEAYAHMRAMFEDTLRIQNEARAAKGQAPITEMEAYLSSRWSGDFRRPVFQAVLDKGGNPIINPDGSIKRKLVYYLAAHSKRGLETQWKALQKDHPDFTFDPKEDHTVRFYKRETDLQSVYSTILDILGDDPKQREAINLITRAVQEQSVNEAASFLGQEKHFKEKSGVRGFVGDRPGKGGTSESLAMFQQQIQYAKNAYKWSELQKAGQDIKQIVSDKDLVKQQPNNVQYIKEYFKNNVGYGESVAMAHLEDAVRNLGFSPSILNSAVGSMKSYFILQKLALNSGYTIANILQTVNVLPHLAALHGQGIKGNALTAIPMGIAGGIAMATGHYVNFLKGRGSAGFIGTPEGMFLNRAFKYAEDNGVTARALYDEAPIESSFSKVGMAANALGKTMSVSEAFVRSMSYMTFVQWLKDSKAYKSDMEIFQKAEELTNAAMVDYRRGERPMMFEKMGTAGNFLNTLQTYPMNWYNQWNYFGRQAAKGNVAPFLTAIAVQYAMAGAMGIPGFEDMTKIWDFLKDSLPPQIYAKYRDNDFFTDPKMWMVKNFGQASVYGWLSDKSGIGFTSRVNAPTAGQMIQSPGGPLVDVAKQAGNLASAVVDPTNSTKWGQFAMGSVPPGMQGLLEQAPFMEGITYDTRKTADGKTERIYNRPGALETHTGVVTRSPQEEALRNFGLRSQRETVEREAGYRYSQNQKVANQKAKTIPEAMYDAAKRNDKARFKDLYSAYVKLTGSDLSQDTWDAQVKQNYFTTIERASTAVKSVTAMRDVARMNKMLQDVKNEYKQTRP